MNVNCGSETDVPVAEEPSGDADEDVRTIDEEIWVAVEAVEGFSLEYRAKITDSSNMTTTAQTMIVKTLRFKNHVPFST